MSEPQGTGEQERSDPIAVRNAMLEERLNHGNALPTAEVYPILGATFLTSDLQNTFPSGTTLPISKAVEDGKQLSLVLGKDNKIIGGIVLTMDNGLDGRTPTIIDTYIGEEWKKLGYGKRLYLELLKALPMGAEVTSHSNLRPDGQRMWDSLFKVGLAEETRVTAAKEVVGKYKTIIHSPKRK